MDTITIQVESRSVMSGLKKVLQSMNGVVIVPTKRKKKKGIEEAMDDIRCGRVTKYESAEDMFDKLGI
jgi:inorganic diphosphatase